MTVHRLAYGEGFTEIDVPDDRVTAVLEARPAPKVSLSDAFDYAWNHPAGLDDPLARLRPDASLVVVVTDHTRPTPTAELLPILWKRIDERIRPEDVCLLVATGTHRDPTDEELESMLGDCRRRFRVEIHDCDGDLVEVGRSSRGTPILLNRRVVDADQVITLGHIGMHYYAGYSGGRKNLLPGVAGRATIEANHAQLEHPSCEACIYEGNPISEEMSEVTAMVNLAFTVDVVFDADGDVAKVVVGDSEAAHAEGRAFWDELFHIPVGEPADLVIASAGGHPKDINLYQAYKGLYNAARMVRDGGIVFLAAACRDGIGHDVFADWMLRSEQPRDVLRILAREGFRLGGHKAVYLARDLARCSIHLKSWMEPSRVRRFFLQPVDDPRDVLAAARAQGGDAYRVAVMPHAGDTFPVRPGA